MKLKDFLKETGGKTRDFGQMDPRLMQVRPGFNIRDLTTPAAREKLDILKAQIKAEGVLEALEIEFDGEVPWINEGHRRHLVVMELIAEGEDFKTIPVVQERSNIKPATRVLHMLMRSKEDYEPLEYAKGVDRMVNIYGWDKAALAASLGFKSKGSIDDYLAMIGMDDRVKAQVDQGIVSATAALKVTKETRDAKTDPEFAAKLIQDAADEQKRLGKRGKATPKALKAASERAKPKPPAETKVSEPAQDKFEQPGTRADGTSTIITADVTSVPTGEPVSGFQSIDELKETIGELTGGEHAKFEVTILGVSVNEIRRRETELREVEARGPAPQPSNKIEALLVFFATTKDVNSLAFHYVKLVREHDDSSAAGEDNEIPRQLCVACDVAGSLRFPEDWENAKATTELAQVA